MNTRETTIYAFTIFAVAVIFGILGVGMAIYKYVPEIEAKQEIIDSLKADNLTLNKTIRSEGARHLQSVNAFRVEVNRLQTKEPEWEFYRGMYAGCFRFFVIGNKGFSAEQIIGVCNAFTKEHYGYDYYELPDPPVLDRPYIEGKLRGKTS